jgi:inhibitor of KinA sporulation pathway (predicted exonuclease)
MPHWLVIDLEATTDEGGWPITEMEIIEIGATLVDRKGRELDCFQRFVRPLRRPLLTPFCRELTHITQANIDAAQPLAEVWPSFERWLGQHHSRLEGWVSWGDYDRKQLLQEWQRLPFDSALSNGLNGALQLAGLHFTGQQHRALEDARNTARLLPLVLPL